MDYLMEEMKQRGWCLSKHSNQKEYYLKDITTTNNTNKYIIISKEINTSNIEVSTPLKYSNEYNYKTKFVDFTNAYNYILDKINYLK